MSDIVRRFINTGLAFIVVWLVCFIEAAIYETAYGGPFTILISFASKIVVSGVAVGLAVLLGLVLSLPRIKDLWQAIGYWSLSLSVGALAIVVFASKLGLRTVEPVSNYQMMPFGIWCACLFVIAFPIANFPARIVGAFAVKRENSFRIEVRQK